MRYCLCLFSAFVCLVSAGAAQPPKIVAQGTYGFAKGPDGKPLSMLNWVISNGGDGELLLEFGPYGWEGQTLDEQVQLTTDFKAVKYHSALANRLVKHVMDCDLQKAAISCYVDHNGEKETANFTPKGAYVFVDDTPSAMMLGTGGMAAAVPRIAGQVTPVAVVHLEYGAHAEIKVDRVHQVTYVGRKDFEFGLGSVPAHQFHDAVQGSDGNFWVADSGLLLAADEGKGPRFQLLSLSDEAHTLLPDLKPK
jgi:hypothetical protein